MIPEGNYKGDVIGADFATASTGTPSINVLFDVQGERRTVYLYLTDNCMGHDSDGKPRVTQKALEALGYNGDDPPTFANGQGVHLWCKHEQYNGQTNEKWMISTPRESTPPPAGVVDRFRSQWRALSGNRPAATRTPAPPPKSAPPPPPGPDPESDEWTKNSAWDFIEKELAKKGEKPITSEWYAAIKSVNKAENKFTSDDWKSVVNSYLNLPPI